MSRIGTIIPLMICLFVGWQARIVADSVDAWIRLGDEAHAAFDNRAATTYYRKAWERDGRNPDLLGKLTWACINLGEDTATAAAEPYFEQAAAYAEELKQLAPDSPQGWFLWAVANGKLAQLAGGGRQVRLSRNVAAGGRRAIALDPTFAPGYVTMGVYYREVAGVNRALRLLANRFLGGMPEGTLEDSEKMLRKGVELDPASIYAHFQLAQTYEAMDKPHQAARHYRRVRDLSVADHQDPGFQTIARKRLAELP